MIRDVSMRGFTKWRRMFAWIGGIGFRTPKKAGRRGSSDRRDAVDVIGLGISVQCAVFRAGAERVEGQGLSFKLEASGFGGGMGTIMSLRPKRRQVADVAEAEAEGRARRKRRRIRRC